MPERLDWGTATGRRKGSMVDLFYVNVNAHTAHLTICDCCKTTCNISITLSIYLQKILPANERSSLDMIISRVLV